MHVKKKSLLEILRIQTHHNKVPPKVFVDAVQLAQLLLHNRTWPGNTNLQWSVICYTHLNSQHNNALIASPSIHTNLDKWATSCFSREKNVSLGAWVIHQPIPGTAEVMTQFNELIRRKKTEKWFLEVLTQPTWQERWKLWTVDSIHLTSVKYSYYLITKW